MKKLLTIILFLISGVCYGQSYATKTALRDSIAKIRNEYKKAVKDTAAKIRSEYITADIATLNNAKAYANAQPFVKQSDLETIFAPYLKTADLPGQLTALGISRDKILVYDAKKFIVTIIADSVKITLR